MYEVTELPRGNGRAIGSLVILTYKANAHVQKC